MLQRPSVKENVFPLLVGFQVGADALETSVENPQKAKDKYPI